MQLTFLALIATTVPTSAAFAPPGTGGEEERWARFDADLERFVAASPSSVDETTQVRGLLKATWAHLPNVDPSGEDNAGLSLDRAQLGIGGELAKGIGYELTLEGAGGSALVLDAFGTWELCEYAMLSFGKFRAPTVWESHLADSDLLFILRTDTGELFYTRDQGAMVSGSLEQFHWSAAVQNGLDQMTDATSFSARASLDVLGGGVGLHQGAFEDSRDAKLSIGAGYYDEQSQGDGKSGDVVVADAQFQWERFAVDGMVGKYQDFTHPLFVDRSESVPWNVAASFMVIEDRVEAAARYQETDNVRHEKDVTIGVNYYLDGHALKVQVNASYIFSDFDSFDDTIRVGIGANMRI